MTITCAKKEKKENLPTIFGHHFLDVVMSTGEFENKETAEEEFAMADKTDLKILISVFEGIRKEQVNYFVSHRYNKQKKTTTVQDN